jgi:hypothetical protein
VVIRAALAAVVLASTAHADNLLGTRVGYGSIPVGDQPMTTMSLAVTFDHPIAGRWRIAAEYEYLWIGERDFDAHEENGVASLSDSGHRAHLGMRRRVLERQWADGQVELFLDGEAGGGVMLVDREHGALALPHAFVGLRAGLALDMETRWEYELFVRGLGLSDGPGVLFGIGLVWGD